MTESSDSAWEPSLTSRGTQSSYVRVLTLSFLWMFNEAIYVLRDPLHWTHMLMDRADRVSGGGCSRGPHPRDTHEIFGAVAYGGVCVATRTDTNFFFIDVLIAQHATLKALKFH
eukprot:Blabericola_migrator_1__11139@NODE_651_length_7047_cov_201_880372_g477_i0_p6_GENE_NODE_651_length_7047_cov_201_880372_g477_i0NODE_651_length_7047_cov_201_880372_g477_i0_p6_ORF_typecomplete_len114_score13_15_NODE_651_length_7047_cov_201_880372_g477_i033153656